MGTALTSDYGSPVQLLTAVQLLKHRHLLISLFEAESVWCGLAKEQESCSVTDQSCLHKPACAHLHIGKADSRQDDGYLIDTLLLLCCQSSCCWDAPHCRTAIISK